MTTATIWLLLAVSTGIGNVGTTTVLARFASEQSCEATKARMPATNVVSAYCVKADGALL